MVCVNRRPPLRAVAAGELFGYRLARCLTPRSGRSTPEEAVSAELAAALRISQGLAGQLVALTCPGAMRERLPKVGICFKAGEDIHQRKFFRRSWSIAPISSTDCQVLAAVDGQRADKGDLRGPAHYREAARWAY